MALSVFDQYARDRIVQKLADLKRASPRGHSYNNMATAIGDHSGTVFYAEYLKRLRSGSLSDALTENVVAWIEAKHDKGFRDKLKPDGLFQRYGETSRDYYFHLPQIDEYETWEEEVIEAFGGVYLCAPANDRNSFLPLPDVQNFFDTLRDRPDSDRVRRSTDPKLYVADRSFLVLRPTPAGYYHAAEIPMSAFLPREQAPLDYRAVYEGIAFASANSIHVSLRECLSRVPKTHSVLISSKNKNQSENPLGLSLMVPLEVRDQVRAHWRAMTAPSLEHMRREFEWPIASDTYLSGTAQVSLSPLPNVRNRVETTYATDLVYHQKATDFVKELDLHVIGAKAGVTAEIERVLSNPLFASVLL